MKINNIKINGFGKITNKEYNFESKINIIYGKNEAGKSSLQKFIQSMLYGVSKNKNGKEISDYDKYLPWFSNLYSGRIEYSLDNGKSFEIFRDFKKKNPVIYNSNKEDISKEFEIDKTKGIEFFANQTGIDETIFLNTAISEQEGVRINQNTQNTIVQRISNLISTGDDNISYKKIFDKLNKNQTEKIGTDRTSQKPLNIVNEELNGLLAKKEELELLKDTINEDIAESKILKESLELKKNKEKFLKRSKQYFEENKIKEANLNGKIGVIESYQNKIEELKNKIDNNAKENIKKEKINLNVNFVFIFFIILISVVLFISLENKIYTLIGAFCLFIGIILTLIKFLKFKKNKQNKILELENIEKNIKSEVKRLEEVTDKEIESYYEEFEKFKKEQEGKKEVLKIEFSKQIGYTYVFEAIEYKYEKLVEELAKIEEEIRNDEIKYQTLKYHINEVNSKLEEYSKIEEEFSFYKNRKQELLELNNNYEIAKECLEKAYEISKQNISPKFAQYLSDTIKKISNGKYQKILVNDTAGLIVEVENGEYLPINRLSTGTIDQMYLSLRLSALKEISSENMPIILDEAFAYFDNERLSNILEYIYNNYSEYQVLIFTCSNREKEALEHLNYEYNLINLEK